MLYKKPVLKPYFKGSSAAFSLVEVLMTLLLIALIIISIAPIITKRTASRNIEGVVFTYKGNNVTQDNKCFLTSTNNYGSSFNPASDIEFLTTKDCSEYEFRAPAGVKTVNLTLVAGGGGGGGAAGGTLQERTLSAAPSTATPSITTSISNANRDEIRKIKIDYLVGRGENGRISENSEHSYVSTENRTHDYNLLYEYPKLDFYNEIGQYTGGYDYQQYVAVYTGNGGDSSSAIHDYEVPINLYRYLHENVSQNGGILRNQIGQVELGCTNTYHSPYGLYTLLNEDDINLFKYMATYSGFDYHFISFGCVYPEYNKTTGRYTTHDFTKKEVDLASSTHYCGLNNQTKYNNCGSLIRKNNVLYSINGKSTVNGLQQNGVPTGELTLNQSYAFGLKKGGEGGVLPMYPNYGKGGRGQGTVANFQDCVQVTDKGYYGGKEYFQSGLCSYIEGLTNEQKISKYCKKDNYIEYINKPGGSVEEIPHNLKNDCITSINNNNLNKWCSKCNDKVCISGEPQTFVTDVKYFSCPVEGTSGTWSGQAGGPSFGKVTYTIERPGGIGGGGSGATYIQIKNFPVEEGARYVVRVGKGGDGGRSGQYGYLNGTSKTSTSGQNGAGGVTSSIWKRENDTETLLYMVIGGAGGEGGRIYSGNDSSSAYMNTTVYDNDRGNSGRTIPTIIYRNSDSINNIGDGTYINTRTLPNSNINFLSGYSYDYLGYNSFDDNSPHSFLNGDFTSAATTDILSGSSNFTRNATQNTIGTRQYLTSYYYRTLVGDQIGYAGGLGGFSGLGGKAGCGGLFIGNSNGYDGDTTTPHYNSEGAKKLFISNGSNLSMAEIFDYYENCTTDTPNGQSAAFVAPSPQKRTLGQAGAGGGGGGYKMFYGGGNGGNGQNGYVMIDWRK